MISIKVDTKQVEEMLKGASRQIPFAISLGLNRTAQHVKQAVQSEMGRALDRPTRYTMNSLKITPSTKTKLEASVWFKQPEGRRDHYLLPQVFGGGRKMKAWEKSIGGHYAMPTRRTQLDQYGNLGRGQITKLRALFGRTDISGFDATTKSKAKRSQYFKITKPKGQLLAGIYERVQGNEAAGRVGRYMIARDLSKQQRKFMGPIQGGRTSLAQLNARTRSLYPRGIKRIVAFREQAPKYGSRLDFFGVANRTIDKVLMLNMRSAVEDALKTQKAYQQAFSW